MSYQSLLDSLEEEAKTTHTVTANDVTSENYSLEPTIVIDSGLRKITIPDTLSKIGVTGDQNAETLQFQIPRYFDGRDLSTHSIVVRYLNANKEYGEYDVPTDDIKVDDTCIEFIWILSNYVTRYSGTVSFTVQFETTTDGAITYQWQTTPATLTVLSGIDTSSVITDKDDSLYRKLINMVTSLSDQITTLTNKVNSLPSEEAYNELEQRVTYLENHVVYTLDD